MRMVSLNSLLIIVFNGIQHIQVRCNIGRKKILHKLVAQSKLNNGKIAAFVLPQFVKEDDPLSFVKNEFNGVVIESHFADKQFFYGKGCPEASNSSAVLSDISRIAV